MYPNPNNGQFVLTNPSASELNVTIYNTVGEIIFSSVSSQSKMNLNISNGKGLYFVKAVDDEGQSSIIKVVVK